MRICANCGTEIKLTEAGWEHIDGLLYDTLVCYYLPVYARPVES